MKPVTLITFAFLFSVQAYATTAVLCGNPEIVDEDESRALLHLIFDNSTSREPNQIRLYSKGKEFEINFVNEKVGVISLALKNTDSVVQISSNFIDSSNCENYSEETFQINVISKNKKSFIEQCRCFQD